MAYISIKEATEQTGKNEKTIRRLVKKPESKRHVKIQEGKIYIDIDYLYRVYRPGHLSTQDPGHLSTQETGHLDITESSESKEDKPQYLDAVLKSKDETIQVLSSQLDMMTRQLDSKDNTISQLIERTREQNIIIQSLQDKVKTLPAPTVIQEKQRIEKPETDIWTKILVAAFIIFMIMVIWYLFKPQ